MNKLVAAFLCLFTIVASAASWRFIKTAAAPAFSPANLTSLQLWLDSADVLNGSNPSHNTKFATWNDKSGNGFDFTQAVSGNQFTYGSAQVNGLDVVVADGSANTYMGNVHQFLDTGTPFTIFLTVEVTSALGTKFLANFVNGVVAGGTVVAMTNTDISLVQQSTWLGSFWNTSNSSSTIYMFEFGYNGSGATTAGNFLCRKNGSTLTRGGTNGGAGSNAMTAMGSDIVDSSLAMSGYILDVVVQAAVATGTEETNMLNYEKAKWNF